LKASVLIVGFHTYDEIGRCVTSIERYEPDVEIIVVDHDADPEHGRRLAAAHPGLKYIPRSDNRGFAAGINQAARLASAPLLLVLNPDVELHAPVIDSLARCLAAHPDAAIVGGLVREADGRVQASARRFPDVSTAIAGRTSWLTRVFPGNPLTRRNLSATNVEGGCSEVDWVTGAFMLIRREVFETLNGFDEGFFLYWEDSDLCFRALKAGWKTFYEPGVAVVHSTGSASRHAPLRSLIAFHRSVFRYYWKHSGPLGRLLSPIVAVGLGGRLLLRLFANRHRG
jgi:N-acetylglucosaminyl-diphospho-decaprenol L-rhamnosyltransferase